MSPDLPLPSNGTSQKLQASRGLQPATERSHTISEIPRPAVTNSRKLYHELTFEYLGNSDRVENARCAHWKLELY